MIRKPLHVQIIFSPLCILFLVLTYSLVFGQVKNQTPNNQDQIKKLIGAVETAPNNIKNHEAFINEMNFNTGAIKRQYDNWIKRFPNSAIVPFAIGKFYASHEDLTSKEYLLKAVAIDSNLSEAWKLLSIDEMMLLNRTKKIEYMEHAQRADPKNPEYAFYYGRYLKDTYPMKYDSLMLDVVRRFPDSPYAVQALYELADYAFNDNNKITYYEILYNKYSSRHDDWFLAGMDNYFDYLINTSPDKAFILASKMVSTVNANRDVWKEKVVQARFFSEANKLFEEHRFADAADLLAKINLNLSNYRLRINADVKLALFKAEIEDSLHRTRSAYDSLTLFYSATPKDKIYSALLRYAKKLHIDSIQVDSDVWHVINIRHIPETKFTFERYPDKMPVSLSDFKGKVVLLTVWFPGCGPCRTELPYFEVVLKKFNREKVSYLAINLDNLQENCLPAILQSNNYSFIPLRDTEAQTAENLPRSNVAPQNFLIDQRGRIIFSNFKIDEKKQDMLELMIKEVLKNGDR